MDIIFTHHALDRAKQRHLNLNEIEKTLRQPDHKYPTDEPHQFKFTKKISQRRYQVIAKYLTDQRKWLIVSAWVRGEEDPEPLLWTILAAPFRLLWSILSWLSKRVFQSNPPKAKK